MPLITLVSSTLTKVGKKYLQDPAKFVAGNIFPMCPVMELAGKYPTYPKEYWMKNEAAIRAPGTESTGGIHVRGEDTYSCEDVSYHEDVPFEYSKNDPTPLNSEKAALQRVNVKISIKDEVDFVANFFASGKWATDVTPGTLWDAANSTPVDDVDGYKQTIAVTGFEANKFVLGRAVYDVLKRHPTITEQVKYTSGANVNKAQLAEIFEVEQVVVMNAVYDSAKFGATSNQTFIAGSDALLLHVTKNPSLESPSAGYNFTWGGLGTEGYAVRQFELEKAMATRVEAHHYHDMKLMATDLGVFIDTPLT